ncbi:MAG: hypothetical protein RIS35_988 [Pseudomonadota bacterium]
MTPEQNDRPPSSDAAGTETSERNEDARDGSASPEAGDAAPGQRETKALALIAEHVPWAAGAGLIPVPALDMAALVGLQLRMLARMSALYGVPFSESRTKSAVASLLGTVLASGTGAALGSLVKFVPVVGSLVGLAATPAAFAAATHAIGRVFLMHFEAGGTFLDFDPARTRDHFRAEFEREQAARKA